MENFKVGDKVSSPVYGKGTVYKVNPIHDDFQVNFENHPAFIGYTRDTKDLYKGHGTFDIKFIKDKEPIKKYRVLFINNGRLSITAEHYKDEKDWVESCPYSKRSVFKQLLESTEQITYE